MVKCGNLNVLKPYVSNMIEVPPHTAHGRRRAIELTTFEEATDLPYKMADSEIANGITSLSSPV